MKETNMKNNWFMVSCALLGVIIGILLSSAHHQLKPKPLQNVVCDTSYGVQYFEHKGVLTLRVNHEGTPIRCFK